MKLTPLRLLALFLVLGFLALLVVGWVIVGDRRIDANQLRFLADIIIKAEKINRALPDSIDDALQSTGTTLFSRNDVGGTSYWRFDDHAFLIRSDGENLEDENGQGDDIDICYLSGREVSRKEMLDYLKKTRPEISEAVEILVTGKGEKELLAKTFASSSGKVGLQECEKILSAQFPKGTVLLDSWYERGLDGSLYLKVKIPASGFDAFIDNFKGIQWSQKVALMGDRRNLDWWRPQSVTNPNVGLLRQARTQMSVLYSTALKDSVEVYIHWFETW